MIVIVITHRNNNYVHNDSNNNNNSSSSSDNDNNDSKDTANLRTKILDFRGFDSCIVLILGGGIPRPTGNSLESLSQAILAGRDNLSREIGRTKKAREFWRARRL